VRGGAPSDWIRPLDPDGQRSAHIVGTYTGHYEHWNLRGLRPGFTARYVSKRLVSQRARLGWRKATEADAQMGEMPYGLPQQMGSDITTAETVLMICPIDVYAARHKARIERDNQLVRGDFTRRSHPLESQYAREGRPTRFSLPDHGISRSERMT